MSLEDRAQLVRWTPSDMYAAWSLAQLLRTANRAALEVGDLELARWCVREWADAANEYAEAQCMPLAALW